ncbi:HAD family hydrolase [Lactobacillus sp. DCY120]|uniref:HAD family hydrolase n=1 Tax=Bombilactobacillus apium TaxID=2675299 RepID=A0A850R2M2_9LACO|nr:HAD family hydrolase [Bombilactobacillus apium]NVY96261.1 HAD family hydrolase [Bombilactobacillus apium]
MVKNIIFDIDGTLLDTKEAGLAALQKTLLEEYNIKQTIAELEFAFSSTADQVFKKYQIPESEYTSMAQKVTSNAFEFTDEVKPFPGIKFLLAELNHRQVPMAVVTSETRDELEDIFLQTSISPYFHHFVTADQVSHPKPAAEPTLKALELLEARPEETLFVGDAATDIGSAHHADVAFGLATWGANSSQDFTEAEYQFQTPQEILATLN